VAHPWGGFATPRNTEKKLFFLLLLISIIAIVLHHFGKCERMELCVMSYCREGNAAREVVYGQKIKSLFGMFLGLTRYRRRFMLEANFDGK
jgi:hypothetical protein